MEPQHPSPTLEIRAIEGLPEVAPGADLARLLCQAAEERGTALAAGDVLVLAQKIVSKAEGCLVELRGVEPSAFARSIAEPFGKDPRQVEVILRQSKRIVRMDAGVIVAETHHGFICANAGVDSSNVAEGWVALLPPDPDASAAGIAAGIARRIGGSVAVIISDTFGRPWREGLTNIAVGIAGMPPLLDYRGQDDPQGRRLSATVIAAADELAAAAELVMGKTSQRPAAIIRHFTWKPAAGSAKELIRPREKDLFR